MQDVENLDAWFCDAVEDHILSDGKTPIGLPQVVATAAGIWIVRQQVESVS